MKQQHYIFGLVGIGAVAVLYLLWRENQSAQNTVAATPVVTGNGIPTYPNAAPINMGDVYISGATPSSQSYNAPADASLYDVVKVGPQPHDGTLQSACGCQDADCESAGVPVTFQTIPHDVLQRASESLSSFAAKTSGPTGGVAAARVTFSAGPPPAASGGTLAA